jgi:predicted N-acetyltransferase YhbS
MSGDGSKRLPEGHYFVDTITESQIPELMVLYAKEFWTHQRTIDKVKIMLQNTDVVLGLIDPEGHLIAFARALTDYIYRATIYDVIVHPSRRGQGLGKMIVDELLSHPKLKDVEQFVLFCLPDMMPFYEDFGFQHSTKLQLMMYYPNKPESN